MTAKIIHAIVLLYVTVCKKREALRCVIFTVVFVIVFSLFRQILRSSLTNFITNLNFISVLLNIDLFIVEKPKVSMLIVHKKFVGVFFFC